MKIGKYLYTYHNWEIVNNKDRFNGWTISCGMIFEFEKFIYKTYADCIQAIKKLEDGTNTREPRIIGEMTMEQYFHSFRVFDNDIF